MEIAISLPRSVTERTRTKQTLPPGVLTLARPPVHNLGARAEALVISFKCSDRNYLYRVLAQLSRAFVESFSIGIVEQEKRFLFLTRSPIMNYATQAHEGSRTSRTITAQIRADSTVYAY